jgi:hypothetical protein
MTLSEKLADEAFGEKYSMSHFVIAFLVTSYLMNGDWPRAGLSLAIGLPFLIAVEIYRGRQA